jgi:hypothetical protein
MSKGVFVTAITCMDGRVQEPVSSWLKQRFAADYVDTVTEPGPDGILADGPADTIDSIRRRAEVSVNAHGSGLIAVVSHDDCTGNPVFVDTHLDQLERSVSLVGSWGLPVRVLGLWVNAQWEVEMRFDSQAG